MEKVTKPLSVGMKLLHFIYFPEEFIVYSDNIVRILFSMYYLPIMAVTLAVIHSLLETIVYTLIVPLARALEYHAEQGASSSPDPKQMFMFLLSLSLAVLPLAIFGGGVAVVGHKVLNSIGEAMVDAFSKHEGKDYPLLAARLEFIFQKPTRVRIFFVSLFGLLSVFMFVFFSDFMMVWSSREPLVVTTAWAIIAVQACFILSTALYFQRPQGPFLSYFVGDWWRTSIHRIRHLSFEMVMLFGAYCFVTRGPADALAFSVEVLFYLNLPHIFGFLVLSFSVALARCVRSLHWLSRHLNEFPTVLVLVVPQQCLIFLSFATLGFHPFLLILFLVLSVLLWSRAIELMREFDVSPLGHVEWREADTGKRVAVYYAAMLEDAFEKDHTSPAMVCLDVRADLKKMTMTTKGEASPTALSRTVKPSRQPPSKKPVLRSLRFFQFTYPRLFTLQSAGTFGGNRFRNIRVFLRLVTMTLLLVFSLIVIVMCLQAALPQLRPLPVRASRSGNQLTIDHIVLKLLITGRDAPSLRGDPTHLSVMDQYPSLCRKEFFDTSTLELALFANAAYLSSSEDLTVLTNFLNEFTDGDWIVRSPVSSALHLWNDFVEFYSPRRNLSAVAIRGTDMTSAADVIHDINMFFEAGLYAILSHTVPGAALLPSPLIADFILLGSGAGMLSRTDAWQKLVRHRWAGTRDVEYYSNVYHHVFQLESATPQRNVVLVGHSLGGAVSHLVGCKMEKLSLGFSSPGLLLSRKKFGVSTALINRYTTTVIPSNDIVPYIGGQAGELHHMDCRAETRELCHAMEFAVGNLWDSCGSLRRRFPKIASIMIHR